MVKRKNLKGRQKCQLPSSILLSFYIVLLFRDRNGERIPHFSNSTAKTQPKPITRETPSPVRKRITRPRRASVVTPQAIDMEAQRRVDSEFGFDDAPLIKSLPSKRYSLFLFIFS